MDRVLMAPRRHDMGDVVGSCMGEHIVAVRESVMQVRRTMVGIRVPPGVGVVVAMGGACK